MYISQGELIVVIAIAYLVVGLFAWILKMGAQSITFLIGSFLAFVMVLGAWVFWPITVWRRN